ncbi:MAG: FHA domain-containing protein [Burkholderiales bacterium]|nr:FHA domain-containing protein [Burkholderiales bacterium]
MAKLILSLDGMMLREYPLTKERTTIGRKPHNDVVIDNLAVSGEHAMIMTILNDSFLEDLGSTNGTQVNGQSIKKHFLQTNDVIELGKYKLKYLSEVAAAQPSQQDFEKTMVLRAPPMAPAESPPAVAAAPAAAAAAAAAPEPRSLRDTVVDPAQADALASTDLGHPASAASTPEPQPAAAAAVAATAAARPAPAAVPPSTVVATAAAMAGGGEAAVEAPAPAQAVARPAVATAALGVIQILSGPSAGKELPLTKALTTLGKPGVQVAVIARRPQGYFITHVEGGNFPVLNGRSLDAQAHALTDHDVVELAGVKMEFFLKPNA